MREQEQLKGLSERVSQLEERVGSATVWDSLRAISWMRWIPGVVIFLVVSWLLLAGARIVLVPLLASIALAYLLAPVTAWLERLGWSRTLASLLTVLGVGLAGVLAVIFLVPSIWGQLVTSYQHAQGMLQDQARIDETLRRIRAASPAVSGYLDQIIASVRDPVRQVAMRSVVMGWMQSGLFGLVDLTTSIIDLLLIPFFVFYLLSDHNQTREVVNKLIPPRNRGIAMELIDSVSGVLSTYVRNQMLISIIMGSLYATGFLVFRVPLGVTVGLLAGLLNFVPYLGTVTGLVLSLVFVVLDGASLWRVAGVIGVFGVVQAIEGYYLTPKLLGTRLNLHPMVVLLGLMVGGNLFGLAGIILALPVIAVLKVVFQFSLRGYQTTDFYKKSSTELVTGAGAPVDLDAQAPTGSVVTPATFEDTPRREPRLVITTGELRSRRPPPTTPDD
jgi:predicted PurR-regulated permease PerM